MKSTLKIQTQFCANRGEFLIKDSMWSMKVNLIHMK